MDFLEKDLETIIWESDKTKLEDRGLCISGKLFRQLKIGNYGVADLIEVERQSAYGDYVDPKLIITVYELKKDKVGISAFLQAVRYCKGISSYLNKREIYDFSFKICLIGKSVDIDGSLIYLTDLINADSDNSNSNGYLLDVLYYVYEYKIDGLKFEQVSNYRLINEGF